jgi:NodT family efflux transporter outer membrane factor (OMF) lipoprotein
MTAQLTSQSFARISFSLLLVISLYGCVSPVKHLPEQAQIEVPNKWQTNAKEQAPTKEIEASPAVKDNWLNSFNDDELSKYVQVALDKNPDLIASASQLKSAIEQNKISGSALWPQINLGLDKSRTETESNLVSTTIRTVSAALEVSWEADIWGKLSQRRKATLLDTKAQSNLFKAAELSLVANVARSWFNLITSKLQLDLASKRLDSFIRTASIIEESYRSGLRSALDVYSSRSDVQLQKAALTDSRFQYLQSLRSFHTLLGEYPDSTLEFTADLPKISNSTPAGLPAELLERRPDLKAAQYSYNAQIERAKAANRDRFPSLTLRGSIGDSREELDQLFEGDNLLTTLVAGLTQPIFQAGALKSRQNQAVLSAEAAYASLVKTALVAFEEVENGLSQEDALRQRHKSISQAVDYASSGLDLALDQYQSGIVSYNTVLQAQRRLYDSLENELNLRNAILQNRIGLHLALGGNFTDG